MSIFYDNVDKYESGADKLLERKELQKEMNSISSNIREQYKNVEARDISRMKDFMYFYKKDWDTDPFDPNEDADVKCRLAQKLRAAREAILVLREFGKLDLLTPFINSLASDGIHLSVDNNRGSVSANAALDSLVYYKGQIDDITDSYKDDIKAEAVNVGAATERGYDVIARTLMKTRSNKQKDIDKCNEQLQTNIADALLDQNTLVDCVSYINKTN